MSTFESEGYRWRETYFVLFESAQRPALDRVVKRLKRLNKRFELVEQRADEQGQFESLTLRSPQDYAALDISYLAGEEVIEQGQVLADEMRRNASDETERAKVRRLSSLDARFDILHFEQMIAAETEEDALDEMIDPSALLVVLDALVELTNGVGIDPQSGAVV